MQPIQDTHQSDLQLPDVRRIGYDAPFQWLALGWRDLRASGGLGLFYGIVYTLLGYGVLAATWQSPWLVLTFATGFLLVAPFLAMGLYDISQQLERGETPSLAHSLNGCKTGCFSVALFALLLGVVMVGWIRTSTLLIAIMDIERASFKPDLLSMLQNLFTTGEGLSLLVAFLATGGITALVVFAAAAVSLPMILDRDPGLPTAVGTSLKAVLRNPGPMLLWAFMIAALVAFGTATLYLGLILIMPVIGHATWHAYRGLVAPAR